MSQTQAPELRSEPFRWFFENRSTGKITIAQWPNWIAAGWVLSAALHRFTSDSIVGDIAGVGSFVFAILWGSSELARGVNPFRRILGAAVLLWQVARLF